MTKTLSSWEVVAGGLCSSTSLKGLDLLGHKKETYVTKDVSEGWGKESGGKLICKNIPERPLRKDSKDRGIHRTPVSQGTADGWPTADNVLQVHGERPSRLCMSKQHPVQRVPSWGSQAWWSSLWWCLRVAATRQCGTTRRHPGLQCHGTTNPQPPGRQHQGTP